MDKLWEKLFVCLRFRRASGYLGQKGVGKAFFLVFVEVFLPDNETNV